MTYTAPTSLLRQQQIQSWGYYGAYGAAQAVASAPKQTVYGAIQCGHEAVGEVRYIVGWASDQMSRMQWDVFVDGSADWELELDNGTTVVSGGQGQTQNPHGKASAEVLKSIGWTTGMVRLVTTNLYVAGELFYVYRNKDWQVLSVIHPDQSSIFKEAEHVVRGLWPSPIDPEQPDAPLFGVLSILEDMDWLARLSRSQSANRVGMRGILGSADGLNFAGGGDFWDEWDKSLRAKMQDPTDVGPVHLRGAKELVEPMASGRGMGGLSWVVPDFPYDARIEGRMEALIHRLAYGLPIPPEILLGLSAQSRATAFQVEENSYRAHIEPPANIVAQVATDVLNTLFADVEIMVKPDPTLLLAKRSTVQDVKDAFDRGTVSEAYFNEVLGIPTWAAPSDDERARRHVIGINQQPGGPPQDGQPGGHSPTTETPRQRAARADRQDPSGAPADQKDLDPTVVAEWRGKIDVASFRARDRLGAKARTHKSLRDVLPSDLPNDEVPAHLGLQALESAGLDVASVVSDSLLFLGPRSCAGDNFVDGLTEHVLATLDSPDPVPLQDAELTKLLQGLANSPD
jgi:hypothetical protein